MKTQADKLLSGCKGFWINGCSACIEKHYCPSCQARLSQYLSDCKDNLEFLKGCRVNSYTGYTIEMLERIIFFYSEIKKLEKAGKK